MKVRQSLRFKLWSIILDYNRIFFNWEKGMDKFIDIFGSTESVFIHDKNHQNQHERVKNWQTSLEVSLFGEIGLQFSDFVTYT